MDNRQAYEFINSEAIREHLRKLDFPLTPVQCAFLVWQSKRHTMKQKHEAWNDIIETLPDCGVEKRMNCRGWDSLHEMLRGYMALEEKCLSLFLDGGGSVFYEYELYEKTGHGWSSGNRHFRSLENCYRTAKEDAEEESCRFRITKRFLVTLPPDSGCEPCIIVEYNTAGDILEIFTNGSSAFFPLTEEEEDLWCCSFDGMWFDIPIPFEKGDIVCDKVNIYTADVPFVLLGTVPWFKKEHPSKQGNYYADYSDMDAYGYSYDREKMFFNDDFRVEYLNLEYYTKPLLGPERLLCAYSQFEKGQIDAYTLLKLYRMIVSEGIAEKERQSLCYLPENVKSSICRTL